MVLFLHGPSEVFQAAIVAGAVFVVAGHNHPSGETVASPEDKAVTIRLRQAGELLRIPVLDHLILSSDGFFSFRENGQI